MTDFLPRGSRLDPRTYVLTAEPHVPGAGWYGVILGDPPSDSLDAARRRPTLWRCNHRHHFVRMAVDCASRAAKRLQP